MTFWEWFEMGAPVTRQSWEVYLDEIIREGCIVDHSDIRVYMHLAYVAGQESVKEGYN